MAIDVGANKWPYTHKNPKDPDATLDYELDWSDWLSPGVSIVGVSVIVDGLTDSGSSFTATTTKAWVSGGTVGGTGSITYRVTTDSSPIAQIDDRTLILRIADR